VVTNGCVALGGRGASHADAVIDAGADAIGADVTDRVGVSVVAGRTELAAATITLAGVSTSTRGRGGAGGCVARRAARRDV